MAGRSSTSSTPELRLTRTLHTLDVTTAASRAGLLLTAITPDAACPVTGAELAEGHGARFADGEESVFLSPAARRIRGAGLSADAAAVLLRLPEPRTSWRRRGWSRRAGYSST